MNPIPPAAPANARTFAQPRLVRRLSVFSIATCLAALLLTLSLPFLQPGDNHWLLLAFCLGFSGYFLYLSLVALRRSGDTVVCADDGLRCDSPNGSSLFIPWDEIAHVDVQNVMQRLVVVDFTGTRRIVLEYHLQDFGELRRTVLERATRRADGHGADT